MIQNVPIKNLIKSRIEHPAHNYCNKTNIKVYFKKIKASPKTYIMKLKRKLSLRFSVLIFTLMFHQLSKIAAF